MFGVESAARDVTRRSLGVTCGTDGRLHQIDELVLAADLAGGTGQLAALCGRTVIAAAMSDRPGAPCPLCTAATELESSVRRPPPRRVHLRWPGAGTAELSL